VPHLATCIFFLFNYWMNQDGYFNWPGMVLTPFPSSIGWDKIRTHNLLIVNLVCYPLDQAFALLPCTLGLLFTLKCAADNVRLKNKIIKILFHLWDIHFTIHVFLNVVLLLVIHFFHLLINLNNIFSNTFVKFNMKNI